MKKVAFFGSSHTYGSCSDVENERIDHAWPEHVAEKLGVDHLNFGLPGCPNLEIQILLTEAINDGLLDDVDTVIMEPRLSYDHILWNNYDRDHQGTLPLYARTKSGQVRFGAEKSKRTSLHHKYVQEINLNSLDSTEEYERKMKRPIHKLMLDNLRRAIETLYYYNQDAMGTLYQSYQYIRTWKSMCDMLDKKFYWMNWSSIYGENKDNAILDSYFQDILDRCINPHLSVWDFIEKKSLNHNKNYFCGCKHFNVQAQPFIAEFVIENIKRVDNQLTTR